MGSCPGRPQPGGLGGVARPAGQGAVPAHTVGRGPRRPDSPGGGLPPPQRAHRARVRGDGGQGAASRAAGQAGGRRARGVQRGRSGLLPGGGRCGGAFRSRGRLCGGLRLRDRRRPGLPWDPPTPPAHTRAGSTDAVVGCVPGSGLPYLAAGDLRVWVRRLDDGPRGSSAAGGRAARDPGPGGRPVRHRRGDLHGGVLRLGALRGPALRRGSHAHPARRCRAHTHLLFCSLPPVFRTAALRLRRVLRGGPGPGVDGCLHGAGPAGPGGRVRSRLHRAPGSARPHGTLRGRRGGQRPRATARVLAGRAVHGRCGPAASSGRARGRSPGPRSRPGRRFG